MFLGGHKLLMVQSSIIFLAFHGFYFLIKRFSPRVAAGRPGYM
jgi:hypothetical protein